MDSGTNVPVDLLPGIVSAAALTSGGFEHCHILEKFSLLGCVLGGTPPHAELEQWACVSVHSSLQSLQLSLLS